MKFGWDYSEAKSWDLCSAQTQLQWDARSLQRQILCNRLFDQVMNINWFRSVPLPDTEYVNGVLNQLNVWVVIFRLYI
jgi:hypothetical protein